MNSYPHPTDKELAEENQKLLFVKDAMPGGWLEYSEELAKAAEALWSNRDDAMQYYVQTQSDKSIHIKETLAHARSYILLAGFALENVLKADLIADDLSLIKTGELVRSLTNHNLLVLSEGVQGLLRSKEEKNILRVCQDAIPYWGRYPIPLTFHRMHAPEAATNEFRDVFRALRFRLSKQVYEKIKDGWDSQVGPKILSCRSTEYGDEIVHKKTFPWYEQ